MIANRLHSDFQSRVMTWRSAAGGVQAGGDWCEVVALSEFRFAVTIGDVSGHGQAVSATMAMLRASVLDAIRDACTPASALARANEIACTFGGGVIVTAIVAIVDERARTLTLANAGHPPPLMLTPDAPAFIACVPADLPLGVFVSERASEHIVALPADAMFVFYTDGITEHARDPIAGEGELIAAARAVFDRPQINAARAIARRIFASGRGADDAAALCVRIPSSRRG